MTRAPRSSGWLVALALVVACATTGDDNAGDGGLSCAEGWVDILGGCEPVLPDEDCPAGTLPVVGEADCRPVGWLECPAGFEAHPSGWGCIDVSPPAPCQGARIGLPGSRTCQPLGDCNRPFPEEGATLFVDDDYTDGQLDATHFRTIASALAAAPAGATIAVEAGTYVESLVPTRDLRLVGRCAERTLVVSDGGAEAGLRVAGSVAVEVRGMTFTGHWFGVTVERGGSLRLEESLLSANRAVGLFVWNQGSQAVVEGSVIRDTRTDGGRFGWGIEVEDGGRVEILDSEISENRLAGVQVVEAGSVASLVGSVVRDTRQDAAGNGGIGVVAGEGAELTLERSVVRGNGEAGVYLRDAGTRAFISGSVVRSTRPNADGIPDPVEPDLFHHYGVGIAAVFGASLAIEASAILDCHSAGVSLAHAATKSVIRGSVIRGTLPAPDGNQGFGVAVVAGAELDLSGSALVENHSEGLLVDEAGSRAVVSGTIIRDTRADARSRGGGVNVQDGARAELDTSALVANTFFGLAAGRSGDGPRTEAICRACVIRDTRPQPDGEFGRGVQVQDGAWVELVGSVVLANREAGVLLSGAGTGARISDTDVRDTLPNEAGSFGRGISVQDGAALELLGGRIVGSREVGLVVTGEASEVRVVGTRIEGTLAQAAGDTFGHGVLVHLGRIVLDEVEIRAHYSIGLAVAAGSGSVSGGVIAGNQVALHVQDGVTIREVETIDGEAGPLEFLVSRDTRFEDNATKVGSGVVPLPEPMKTR